MKIGTKNTDEQVYIIAEIGNNHEGDLKLAEEMIHLAADAGADAVKFQTIRPEFLVSKNDTERFNKLKSFELSFEDYQHLNEVAQKANTTFLSTPFDLEAARFLNDFVPAFKIASSDNNFFPLLECVAQTGKPLIISSGFADLSLIQNTKTFIEDCWKKENINGELAILHCVSNYPTLPEEVNLNVIPAFREALGCTVGYSDHTLGIKASETAVAMGARIIEKHFTIDKNHSDFHDHKISADPKEMKELVEGIREIEVMMGSGDKKLQNNEANAAPLVRRHIISTADLPAGHLLEQQDITWIRGKGDYLAGQETELIGQKLQEAITEGEAFSIKHIN